ncbi:MAG TPA: acyltransferase [Capsulimonadaceae bacterium]|jgi:acetyltransferase-like isoleucine patch superfamily enzyme
MKIVTKFAKSIGSLQAQRRGVTVGPNTFISPRGKVARGHEARIEIGADCTIRTAFSIDAHAGSLIKIGNRVHISERVDIQALPGAEVIIEDDCWFNHDISIVARGKVTIGYRALLAPYCYLIDHDHGIAGHDPIRLQEFVIAPVVIGPEVWLGLGATVLKGVTVGDGAVVAARAVVNKSIPPFEIWGGIPAKRIGERK